MKKNISMISVMLVLLVQSNPVFSKDISSSVSSYENAGKITVHDPRGLTECQNKLKFVVNTLNESGKVIVENPGCMARNGYYIASVSFF